MKMTTEQLKKLIRQEARKCLSEAKKPVHFSNWYGAIACGVDADELSNSEVTEDQGFVTCTGCKKKMPPDDSVEMENFVDDYEAKENSVIGMWMDEDDVQKMFKLHKSGVHFMSVFGDNIHEVKRKADTLKVQGWKIFATEDNYDSPEIVMFRK